MEILQFSDLSRLRLVYSGIVPVQQGYEDGWVWSGYAHAPRPSDALVYVCSDSVLIYETASGEPLTLHRGEVLFVPKGLCYTTRARVGTPAETTSYTVNFSMGTESGEEAKLYTGLTVVARDPAGQLEPLFRELCRVRYGSRTSEPRIQADFLLLLDGVLECASETSREYYTIRRGVELLTAQWREQEKIARYAALCGISLCYFNSLFRKWAGMSPVEYRNRLRINRAQALLQNGGVSVAEVAAQCGFEDSFYFSRLFKQITGMPPQKYKQQFGGV